MNPHHLAIRCAESINSACKYSLPAEDATVLLILPKAWKAPAKFPRGKTAQWKEDGTRVAYFNAMNVLAWLGAQGIVSINLNGYDEQGRQRHDKS